MFNPFLARLDTIRRAVGVPKSVNTVSKLTVSRLNVSTSWGDVVTASDIHELRMPGIVIKPSSPIIVIINWRCIISDVKLPEQVLTPCNYYEKRYGRPNVATMKYVLIAGEASGDLHASQLIKYIREEDPGAEFRFFGGDLMAREARRNPDLHYDKMNVMGFSEVLRALPRILRNMKQAKALLREYRPDAVILVDYPGFNLQVAEYAHKLGIKVHYFISPKVWAWKEWRVPKIKKTVDHMYSILPFEEEFYAKHDYKVEYVGNPSVEEMSYAIGHIPPKKYFLERQGITDPRPIIALLPGSRRGEIRNNLPLMVEAAKRFPEFQYVIGAAPSVPEKFFREIAQDPGLKVVFGCTPTLLKYSQAAVVVSGTATLETALIGTPQVVVYRANGSRISYNIMSHLLKVKYVSLPNLIVNNMIIPELLVDRCTVDAIARELSPLLQPSPKLTFQQQGYKNMQRRLGNSVAAQTAATLIVGYTGKA